jgi:hypothetical protein
VCIRIQELVAASFDGNLPGALTTLLTTLEEQSQQLVAQDDPGNWAEQALLRVQEWVGGVQHSEGDSGWRKSRLGRTLVSALQSLAGEWDTRLSEDIGHLMDHPGARVAAAEVALHKLLGFCQETIAGQQAHLEVQLKRTQHAWLGVQRALENCQTGMGGFTIFGNRSRRLLRVFMDHLAAFGRQRLVEEVFSAALEFWAVLEGRLRDRLTELSFCRQHLRQLQQYLECPPETFADVAVADVLEAPALRPPPETVEKYWESIRESRTAKLVLPDGEASLERAANTFLQTLNQEQWTQLDVMLQERVLEPRGGLKSSCLAGYDMGHSLADPLLREAALFLGDLLPITDVAQIESSAARSPGADPCGRVRSYVDAAAPLVEGQDASTQHTFVLVPASDAGKEFAELCSQAVPGIEVVRVPGQADLMFCREQGYLTPDDLHRVFHSCRQSYDELRPVLTHSPHARFDILDWVPLNP